MLQEVRYLVGFIFAETRRVPTRDPNSQYLMGVYRIGQNSGQGNWPLLSERPIIFLKYYTWLKK